jgi:hypothetical protein
MQNFIPLAVLLLASFTLAATQSDQPIWLSPTNVNTSEDLSEQFPTLGVWTNISVGSGARGLAPLFLMDSKKTLWIMFGQVATTDSTYDAMTVWNYNPKTDLYRWVSGPGNATTQLRNPGQLGVPSPINFPGGVRYTTGAIDHNDNIWFMTTLSCCELWMFNTTSYLFTRVFGPANGVNYGSTPGQPGQDVSPGHVMGACFAADSSNNLWMIGGFSGSYMLNRVWRFNTSSLLWTFIGGNTTAGVNVNTVWGRNAYFGARWVPGCDIDESDRIWIFGGYSIQQTVKNGFFNDVWSFDTKTKEFQLEFGSSTSFRSGPAVVSDDFNTGNHPPSKQYPTLVDRKDGTLIMTGGWGTLTSGVAPAADAVLQNDVWLFNKTLKQWKLIYGDPTKDHLPGNFTHYRTPGSTMPGRYQQGRAKGMSLDGDLFIVGGVTGTVDVPIFLNDMWLIPFDQCASPTSHKCSSDAQCIEEMIGYSCQCNEGFVGDGFECTAVVPPQAPIAEQPVSTPNKTTAASGKLTASLLILSLICLALMN